MILGRFKSKTLTGLSPADKGRWKKTLSYRLWELRMRMLMLLREICRSFFR